MHAADLELVRRARRGDDAAFHELVDRFAADLYGLAVSLVRNAADAEDIVQETLVGAFRHLAAFEERSSVRTWLARILVRQAARWLRKRRGRETAPLEEALVVATRSPTSQVEPRLDLEAMLATLSSEHREVIVLRELEGLAYDEIAGLLGIPRGTVESRLHRARKKLQERFGEYLA